MNTLPLRQAASPGGDNRAGGDGIGTVANSPAQPLVVGSVGFGPSWTVEDSMAASIIRLEQELDEANARIAVLEEEQKILAKANAAVIEGGTGYSGAERPEPSPHFSDTPETDAHSPWRYAITTPNGVTTHFVPADFARRLERERNEARGAVQGYRDAACRASCRDKEAADRAGGDVWSNI